MCYDINFAIESQKLTWQSLIVTDLITEMSSYVTYRSTFGNQNFTSKLFCGFALFVAIIYLVLMLALPTSLFFVVFPATGIFFDAILLVIIVIAWHKTPIFNDVFFVRKLSIHFSVRARAETEVNSS